MRFIGREIVEVVQAMAAYPKISRITGIRYTIQSFAAQCAPTLGQTTSRMNHMYKVPNPIFDLETKMHCAPCRAGTLGCKWKNKTIPGAQGPRGPVGTNRSELTADRHVF